MSEIESILVWGACGLDSSAFWAFFFWRRDFRLGSLWIWGFGFVLLRLIGVFLFGVVFGFKSSFTMRNKVNSTRIDHTWTITLWICFSLKWKRMDLNLKICLCQKWLQRILQWYFWFLFVTFLFHANRLALYPIFHLFFILVLSLFFILFGIIRHQATCSNASNKTTIHQQWIILKFGFIRIDSCFISHTTAITESDQAGRIHNTNPNHHVPPNNHFLLDSPLHSFFLPNPFSSSPLLPSPPSFILNRNTFIHQLSNIRGYLTNRNGLLRMTVISKTIGKSVYFPGEKVNGWDS